jgi:REP element-mobilizing transposase RayT
MPWNKPYIPSRNRRLDPGLYSRAGWVYFVTIRADANESPFVDSALSRLVCEVLVQEAERHDCALLVHCLMPDHLHFLASPNREGSSVLALTEQYKGKSTNLSWTLGWRGRLWQPRYYDHIVRAEEDLRHISEYILNNPVRRGLVERAQDWPWSGCSNPASS